MNRTVTYIALAVGACVISFAAGRITTPTRIETRTEYVDKTVTIRTTQVVRVTDVKWRRVTVTKPDGSSTTTESGEAQSSERSAENAETAKTTERVDVSKKTANVARTTVFVTAGVDLINPRQPVLRYGVSVSHRVMGPLTANVFYLHPGIVGAGLGVAF